MPPTERLPASRVISHLVVMVAVATIMGLVAAGLAIPFAGILGLGSKQVSDGMEMLPAELKAEPLAQKTDIVDARGTLIASVYDENRVNVPLTLVSPMMIKAIVAIEDERFYDHDGVDARGLIRATVNNATSDSTQGASTLTQQFVNNMLVNVQQIRGDSRLTLSGSKNIADKVKDAGAKQLPVPEKAKGLEL